MFTEVKMLVLRISLQQNSKTTLMDSNFYLSLKYYVFPHTPLAKVKEVLYSRFRDMEAVFFRKLFYTDNPYCFHI